MFHATSGVLARMAQRIRGKRLIREQRIAAVNGWQVRRVAAGTYRFRDRRFDHLTAPQATRGTGPDRR